ncbi:MAG: hemerythrin domain-containing protein [Chloroflexi bacterium]|nr:hemerythrin domain-containing protein [Chloroflexota bacterium]
MTIDLSEKIDPIYEFREDHRKVRDSLLDLAAAAEAGDIARAREILGRIDAMVGPHFRYEEETLYPALREYLGEYVDNLVAEHDGAIATARLAAKLLSRDSLTAEEGKAAARAARALLVHVSNCDGLNILAERLPQNRLDELGVRFAKSRAEGLPLLRWADTIRKEYHRN